MRIALRKNKLSHLQNRYAFPNSIIHIIGLKVCRQVSTGNDCRHLTSHCLYGPRACSFQSDFQVLSASSAVTRALLWCSPHVRISLKLRKKWMIPAAATLLKAKMKNLKTCCYSSGDGQQIGLNNGFFLLLSALRVQRLWSIFSHEMHFCWPISLSFRYALRNSGVLVEMSGGLFVKEIVHPKILPSFTHSKHVWVSFFG